MAYDKLCDSAFLDAGLKQIADAIREKAGTSDNLAFPQAMAEAIAAIEAGGVEGMETGSFTPASAIDSYNLFTAAEIKAKHKPNTYHPLVVIVVADDMSASKQADALYQFHILISTDGTVEVKPNNFLYYKNYVGVLRQQAVSAGEAKWDDSTGVTLNASSYKLQPIKYNWFLYDTRKG